MLRVRNSIIFVKRLSFTNSIRVCLWLEFVLISLATFSMHRVRYVGYEQQGNSSKQRNDINAPVQQVRNLLLTTAKNRTQRKLRTEIEIIKSRLLNIILRRSHCVCTQLPHWTISSMRQSVMCLHTTSALVRQFHETVSNVFTHSFRIGPSVPWDSL
jgi:hypothetical protein